MKKVYFGIAAAFAAIALTGCSDAQAKLSDSSTVVVTVGNKTVTKGDVYSLLVSYGGASTVINDANKIVCDAEVEITDDMKATAQSTLNEYKSMYGDTFTTYLESSGLSEEDYMNEYLIPSLQAEQLTDKYVEQKWDYLIEEYQPRKVTMISFESEDDANAALKELKAGDKNASTAASDHNGETDGSEVVTTESSSIDSMVRTVLFSSTPDDGWTMVPSSDGGTFYCVLVEDDDPLNFKEEAVTSLETIDDVSDDATTYFFKKYNFHVYDKTIYDALAADYPENLVQDLTVEDEATDITSTSAPVVETSEAETSSTTSPAATAAATASASANAD